MTERLTDEGLIAWFEAMPIHALGPDTSRVISLIVTELRERRAADLELDDYETVNLLWLVRLASRLNLDTGDWCHQIRHKLEQRGHASVSSPNSGRTDTELRLRTTASRILPAADLTAEEIEALRWLRSRISVHAEFPMFPLQSDENRAACVALTKLIAAHGGKS